ncbi:monoheme cytochrome C [Spongiimicrobium sp. 2-473A-2-J]|uniref:monoheme cytochrome C n=1 Tax=Eudoraea algarum TaxID=3417568 RepID=UPI003D364AC7
MSQEETFRKQVRTVYRYLILFFCGLGLLAAGFIYLLIDPSLSVFDGPSDQLVTEEPSKLEGEIVNGIHLSTGFVEGKGLVQVIQNCTNCHSAALVTQNRMTREGWVSTIRWMQETQNLWDLGDNEEIIVSYLASYYAPEEKGRRENLREIEWYELQLP